jgi:hypothetical protein
MKATRGRGDAETRGYLTRGRGDAETRRSLTRGRGDGETGRRGEKGRSGRGPTESPRPPVSVSPRLVSAIIVAALVFLAPEIALACPSCSFGATTDSPMAKGMNNAIWFLLGVIGFVQIAFVALFISFWRRARSIRKRREQFHLIPGSGWGALR